MTTPNSEAIDVGPADPSQQCMMYLLGELDDSQSKLFERQLAASADLRRELEIQAEVITHVGLSRPDPLVAPASGGQPTSRKWIAAAIATAACIALIVVALKPDRIAESIASNSTSASVDDLSVPEDLLIARAWADARDNDSEIGFAEEEGDEEADLSIADDSDNDATLQWMFIAVSTDTQTESSSDG